MNPSFLKKLRSPGGNILQYDPIQQVLIDDKDNTVFPIQQGVPILLPQDAKERWMEVVLNNGVRARIFYADHYDQDAQAFDYFEEQQDGASRHENRRLRETIIRQVPKDTSDILDVGCGSAWVAGYFCAKGVSVCSMDISLENPRHALKRYPFDNHAALVADAYALPFQQEIFDCIIAAEVMEHAPDPALFIANLWQVLKPGGTLIITTPNREQLIYSLCIHCNRLTPHNAHLHSFNEEHVKKLLLDLNSKHQEVIVFSNKAMSRLQTHLLFQRLPYNIWKLFDYLANRIWNRPMRLLLKASKVEKEVALN